MEQMARKKDNTLESCIASLVYQKDPVVLKRITELSKYFDQANRRLKRQKTEQRKTQENFYKKKFIRERTKFKKQKRNNTKSMNAAMS